MNEGPKNFPGNALREVLLAKETSIRELKERLSRYHTLVSNVFTRRGFLEHENVMAKELMATSTKERP